MAEPGFLELLNDLSAALTSGLQHVAGEGVVAQFSTVIVPVQRIAGVPENFSLMIFPLSQANARRLERYALSGRGELYVHHRRCRI